MATIHVLADHDYNNAGRPINVPDPTNAQDAATKAYVDASVNGLKWKPSVRVAASSNLNLSAPGSSIDGITMATSDRFLALAQSTASQNGIYVWNGAATLATRALDADTAVELEQAIVSVEEGTSADTSYRQEEVNFTLGTDPVTWAVFGATVPDASDTVKGKVELATTAETSTGTDTTRAVTPSGLANSTHAAKRYAVAFGDGSNTSYTITHNLNSEDVEVEVYRNSGNKDKVICEVRRTSVNAVQLVFNTAPTTNQYRVVVQY